MQWFLGFSGQHCLLEQQRPRIGLGCTPCLALHTLPDASEPAVGVQVV